MKKISFLSLLLALLVNLSYAGIYSGMVINSNTSAAVVGQVVELRDSMTNLVMYDTTDANGGYSFTLPSSLPSPDDIYLRVYACGLTHTSISTYTAANPNFTHTFSICATTSPYRLQGDIVVGGSWGAAMVYLIRKSYDSLSSSYVLTAIDSIQTNSIGAYSKNYNSVPYGQLLVKAALNPSDPNYAGYLPTYYTSALNWSGATSIGTANFTNNAITSITMIAGTNPGGPGFIGGLVSQGANKGTAVGDPLSKRILLLTTASGQAVAYTYSNASGQFSFPSLAYGTYKIFGDAWGKTNPQLTITLSASQPTVNDITFEENSTTFKGHTGTLAVGNVSNTLKNVGVFPNPATDYLQLTGLDAINGEKTVQLCNINGAVISTQTLEQGQAARLSVASLPAGVYMLQLRTEAGNAQFKIVK